MKKITPTEPPNSGPSALLIMTDKGAELRRGLGVVYMHNVYIIRCACKWVHNDYTVTMTSLNKKLVPDY